MKTVTVIGHREWNRLPRRLRRRFTDHLRERWSITDLKSVRCLYVIDGRVTGADLYLRDSTGRLILKSQTEIASMRIGRSHG